MILRNSIIDCKDWCLTEVANRQLVVHLDNLNILWFGLFIQICFLFMIFFEKPIVEGGYLKEKHFPIIAFAYVLISFIFPIAYIIALIFYTLR